MAERIVLNGKGFVEDVPEPSGKRVVLVIDRGWIVAGDLEEVKGRLILSRAVHVLSWSGCGFDGMLRNPKSPSVKLKKMDHQLNAPADAEIFRIPVSDDWGL